uniref:GNAT family N-acetyltransferase n=1 Tax=Phenylobacterium glaciei TaxID=2803784 RepID=A0A974P163_9CAUL|nr:GNAT family N-acetyltransferase [Phenylobacterium glaciei]
MTTTPPWLPLETERLLLRDFRENDFDAIHAYAIDPEVVRYMTWGPNTPEVTREVLDRNLDRQKTWPREELSLAVEVKATGEMIGVISLHDANTDNSAFGYCYSRGAWGRAMGPKRPAPWPGSRSRIWAITASGPPATPATTAPTGSWRRWGCAAKATC